MNRLLTPGHVLRHARTACRSGLILALAVLLAALPGPAPARAATGPHGVALAALADLRAAQAELEHALAVTKANAALFKTPAQRAINALLGASDPAFSAAAGNPGDDAGAAGDITRVLALPGDHVWSPALNGALANTQLAAAILGDALKTRDFYKFEMTATQALVDIEIALGRPDRVGGLGGLAGTLATTTLGVPASAATAPACAAPLGSGPVYGTAGDYLLYIAVPTGKAAHFTLPEALASRSISVTKGWVLFRTAAEPLRAKLCRNARHAAAGPPALYTRAQAQAGRAVFMTNCVTCHGANLQGVAAPSVAGTDFLTTAKRNGWSLGVIRALVVQNMPFNNPGGLQPEQYANVLAFLLAANCYPAGNTPFPLHFQPAMNKLLLGPVPGAHPANARTGVCAVP